MRRLFLSLAFVLLGLTSPRPDTLRYVSPWTLIPAGSGVVMAHELGKRPLTATIWTASAVDAKGGESCQTDFVYANLNTTLVVSVGPDAFYVQNQTSQAVCMQAVLLP